ncbi:MAG: hypothetical protein LJE84_13965 [Gammaproteobacteria bacterium]|jgi:hypothetical protein|nr:hypothetical protein [Gammaproteobacteria bacterium]
MMNTAKTRLIALPLFLAAMPLGADDTRQNIENVMKKSLEYVDKGNFVKAMNELDWAKKDIEKLHVAKLLTYLNDELGGFTGAPVQSSGAMGIMAIARDYRKDDIRVKVTITSTGAAQGGLAAFGRMAAMMQRGNPNVETFRVGEQTATLESKASRVNLNVFLEAGPMLGLEMRGSQDAQILKDVLADIPVEKMNSYLKGEGGS